MKLFDSRMTRWIRLSLGLGLLAVLGLTQVGCAYPYPVGGAYYRDSAHRHAPAPYWRHTGHHGHRGYGHHGHGRSGHRW